MKQLFFFTLIIITSARLAAQIDLNKGLVLYLPFKGNTLDASPNANHAINYGATLTADQWGNPNSAYRFNGSSHYMRIQNTASLQCDNQITLCARVLVNGFYDGICYGNSIIDKGTPDYLEGDYHLRFATSISGGNCNVKDTLKQNFYGQFYNEIPSELVRNNPPYIKKGNWDCLIYVFDGVNVKMFVNGILRYSIVAKTTIGVNTQDVFLGRHDDLTYPYWFNGVMDEVRIYNRALNVLEIDSICSKTNPQLAIREVKNEDMPLPVLSNPIKNTLVLGLEEKSMGGLLTIWDLSGRKLIQIAQLNEKTIAVESLETGLYLVSYQLGDISMRVKVFKQ